MALIEIINEVGEIVQQEMLSKSVTLNPDNQDQFEPAVVESIRYDHKGQTSTVTNQCGEAESRRSGDELPDITIEGILTGDQLSDAKALKRNEEITLVSDIHQGQVFVKRLTIVQNSDLVHYRETTEAAPQLAFEFNLELGQPDGSSGNG